MDTQQLNTALAPDASPTQPTAADQTQTPWVSGAEAVVRSLLAEGVDLIFGYPGGAIMPVYDALLGWEDQLRHVLVRHEQGAIHAAQGVARISGRAGVCMATSGPGATNLVTGLADALIDSTPLVVITGQVPTRLLGTDAFQETDVMNLTAPVTKWNVQVTRAADIPAAMAKAFYVAQSGRPGPVLLDITKDAQQGRLQFAYEPCTSLRSYLPTPRPSDEALLAAAHLLNQAERPLIVAGHGVVLSGGEQALLTLAEKTGIPVAWTLLGCDAFPSRHPLAVGMVGMHGRYAPNVMTNACDVLLAVGMRFDDRVTGNPATYARQAKIIHLEIDPAEVGKIITPTVTVLGDAKGSLERICALAAPRQHTAWRAEFAKLDAVEWDKVMRNDLQPSGDALRMGEVIALVAEMTQGQAVIVSDVGQHQMAAARYSDFAVPRTQITSGGLGTMGFALPAALGAKLAAPDRTVVAVIGDGGFQMTMQELGTLMQTRAAVKIVLLNNSFLGMVRQLQELLHGGRYSQTEMDNPDFVQIASAYRMGALCVQTRDELRPALQTMLAARGPFLLDVRVERQENVFPFVPSGASIADIQLEPRQAK